MSEQINEQQTEIPAELLAVTDLDQFIRLLTDWHNRQVATVKHLLQVPVGIKIVIGEGAAAQEKLMEGDFRDGFTLGLDLALNYFGTLPFMAEYVDDTSTHH